MRVAAGLDGLAPSAMPAFVVVGVFDGIHRGHAYLLERLVAEAERRSARPVVITFDHHPDEILVGNAPPILCDPAERLRRLGAAGVDTTVVVPFDRALRETTYDAFVDRIARRTPLDGFLMTPDAAFGFQRGGTPEALADLGAGRGFRVVVVPAFEIDGQAVSSTHVREAIARGDLDRAALMLGRPHAVVGEAGPDGGDAAEGEGSIVRFPLPVALPMPGRYAVTVGRDEAMDDGPSVGGALVTDGSLRLDDRRTGRTRVAFTARR